jgi:hypothetical protein
LVVERERLGYGDERDEVGKEFKSNMCQCGRFTPYSLYFIKFSTPRVRENIFNRK